MYYEMEQSSNPDFYNVVVHLVYNNNMIEETVAIKKIWKKGEFLFLDLYFYRTKKSRVINAAFIHDLLDLTTEKYYDDMNLLYLDYLSRKEETRQEEAEELPPLEKAFDFKSLDNIRDDIVILIFIAKCSRFFSDVKLRVIADYMNRHNTKAQLLSDKFIAAYLQEHNPDEDDFYHALDNLRSKTPEQAAELAAEVIKISLSDGCLQYSERLYLAEIMQALREFGLCPDIGLE